MFYLILHQSKSNVTYRKSEWSESFLFMISWNRVQSVVDGKITGDP